MKRNYYGQVNMPENNKKKLRYRMLQTLFPKTALELHTKYAVQIFVSKINEIEKNDLLRIYKISSGT